MIDRIVKDYSERAKDTSLFGNPISDLSKDELLAVVAWQHDRELKQTETHSRDLNVLSGFKR